MEKELEAAVGQRVSFRKTVSESDVYLFAGITGDFAPNHVDEQFMRQTQYGRRIAHGALLVGYMSRASTMIAEKITGDDAGFYPVSLGYDRVRFLKPVFIGDTITVTYAVTGCEIEKSRTTATVEVLNEQGEVVAAAIHIMKWLVRRE
ncbi:MaoC family dehydratase [Taklimakanibacter deserti]|uniref:MaoC family dehydratase n=1 Tax=Taklimakanibacter deserti TaxID=2267839 RepID=UPI000E646926